MSQDPLRTHLNVYGRGCGHDICSNPRIKVVLGRGAVPCDILFVGEAPGLGENATGKPFMGPAGKLLDSLIARSLVGRGRLCQQCHLQGLRRLLGPDVAFEGGPGVARYVCPHGHAVPHLEHGAGLTTAFTNLVGCLPLAEDGNKNVEPGDDQIMQCKPRLEHFINTVARPAAVVRVGKHAETWLEQGYSHSISVEDEGVVFTNLLHPAFILRGHFAQRSILEQRCVIALNNLVESLCGDTPDGVAVSP